MLSNYCSYYIVRPRFNFIMIFYSALKCVRPIYGDRIVHRIAYVAMGLNVMSEMVIVTVQKVGRVKTVRNVFVRPIYTVRTVHGLASVI